MVLCFGLVDCEQDLVCECGSGELPGTCPAHFQDQLGKAGFQIQDTPRYHKILSDIVRR